MVALRGFTITWGLSLFVALCLSALSSYANASSPKTFNFNIDNDLLVPGSRDQDYTGGFNVSYIGQDINQSSIYFTNTLSAIDQLVILKDSDNQLFGVEVGMYGFTPEDTQLLQVNSDDRPYSSLIYFSNTHERISPDLQQTWQSRLTIGVLGLDIVPNLQKGIHDLTSSQQPKGWNHQISDGGELTLRYQLAEQKAIDLKTSDLEIKYSKQISVGYITEASMSISSRFGQFNSSWWNFNPELSSYGEQRNSLSGNRGENYVFIGASLKYRFYNVFLQGQFRRSNLVYKHDQLNHFLLEAWAGYTHFFDDGYQLSYFIRTQSSEVKTGSANRTLIWGGFSISKSWY